MIAVSIVSHGHGSMVNRLVEALLSCQEIEQVLVTANIPETLELSQSSKIRLIENSAPKGFGANHNAAFTYCSQPYFCPLNPDIELAGNPFPDLIKCIGAVDAALVAPLVIAPDGRLEDSVRRFPTLRSLARKLLGGADGRYRITADHATFHPEWVAGMFMLFRSADFARLNGFDEHFFLYYEDVDICVRAWKQRMKVLVCPSVSVVHDARRDSHRSLRHLRWHVASMGRYFFKHWGRLPHVA